MPSFTTLFRAIVMIGMGAAAFKGWQIYGPPTEKVKSMTDRAIDMAQDAWKNYNTPTSAQETAPAVTPPNIAATITPAATDAPLAPPPLATQSQPLTPDLSIGSAPIGSASLAGLPQTHTSTSVGAPAASESAHGSDERVRLLLTRLEQLGGSNSKVAAWGSTGRLYRCSCQAPAASSASVMQHFEAVAAEPTLAVEQVVAKIEASRTAQRNVSMLR